MESDVPGNGTAAKRVKLTALQWWAVGILAAGSASLTTMAFLGMFRAVRAAAVPFVASTAWMIPVGTDLGIVTMSLFSMFFEWLHMTAGALGARFLTWVFIGLQISINVGAARGNPLGSAIHAVLPLLFIGILESWQYFIRHRRGLAKSRKVGQDRERIPWSRYRADWYGSRDLKRRMVLWGIDRYAEALEMQQRVLYAEAGLAHMYGPQWRKTAPGEVIVMLGTAQYLDRALAEIATERADYDKHRNPRPGWVHYEPDGFALAGPPKRNSGSVGNSASGNDNGGNPASGSNDSNSSNANGVRKPTCTACTVHKTEAAMAGLPRKDAAALGLPVTDAATVWAEYRTVHPGETIGADRLRNLFRIGMAGARELRDELLASGQSTAAQRPRPQVGSGYGGESGPQVGSGYGGESGPQVGSVNGESDGVRVLVGVGTGGE